MNDEIADAVEQICDAVCTVVDEDKTTDDRGAINEQRDDHHADNRNDTPVSQIVTLTSNLRRATFAHRSYSRQKLFITS
ncbi:unnamed protein product [Adineta ricciae]|uniref:Uncharacterized protein n=1 Tax=Adineta ricciae TaxID=249248 RepID=A0A816HM49_ADIRI|nr:unnamed protein product [Adineta ricciae]